MGMQLSTSSWPARLRTRAADLGIDDSDAVDKALSLGQQRLAPREAFEEIKALAVDITASLEQHTGMGAEVAFRHAAESWMQSNNIIRVFQNGQVLPSSYRFQSH